MECEEEEDANSLLSLSQTFLQPDSSSSSISLSTNQLHNWSTLTSTGADVAAQFSPISPAESYNTNSSAGHVLMDNEPNFRFYGARSAASQSAARGSVSNLFSRSGNSGISSVNISNSFPSASRVGGSEFNHGSGHVGIDTSTSLCYEQVCNPRSGSSIYGDKDIGYSNRTGLNSSSNSHHVDTSNVIGTGFAHAGYGDDHGMLSLTSPADDDGKLGNRSIHLDQKLFDSRSKQQDYSKDLSNLYDQPPEKPLQSTEITMSFDRRDANNFDNSFEFSSDSRDFTTSARLDVASVTRGVQDQDYHQSQKYISTQVGDSDVLNGSLSLDSKRVSSSYINFGLSGHVEDTYVRLNNSQKKSTFSHQLNDLPSDLEPVFHGYHTDFGGHQKLLLDSHRNFVANEFQDNEETGRFSLKDQANSRDNNSKWSGRPRAHRKMARLLGSEDHRDYSQMTDANNSHKPFTKAMSSLEPVTQDKSSYQHNLQRDLVTNSRAFLTMEEELDLRTNHHQQRSFATRRDENLDRNQTAQRELGLLQTTSTFSFDSNTMASSMHKDPTATILSSQQFLPSTQLDLDFHATLSVSQSQKDMDLTQHFGLQVSKDFGLEASHSASNQDDLSFDHPGDPQHATQPEISLSDNLGIVSHVQPELSFEAYFNSASERDFSSASDRDFNSTSERDLTFCRKFSSSRDLNYVPSTNVNDFNIEDYMNPQRDLSQSYFNRPDLPQDMTVYQKTPIDKTAITETSSTFKGREKGQSLTADKDKQGEISELQKELTKTSTKESMKGIRIPRDINRAMEILQGLQEDEREEERRKEQQQRHQQQLQGLISSPKKTFQNKHNIESLSLTDQHFMGSSGNFMEDQSVGSFLDHPHLTMPEQPQDNLQMVQSYQPFTQIHQPIEVDMVSTLQGKRDLQQNLAHNMASELDYQILKRLACSTSMKGTTTSQSSSFSNNSTNLASLLVDNSTHDSGMQFPVTGIHFQTQQSDLEDVVSNSILNSSSHSALEVNRPKNEMTFMDFEPQPQHISNEKPQTSVIASDPHLHPSVEISQVIRCKQEAEVLISSRKNLYDMMKREQFCDAVLSTSKQTVKVHQAVLCSMSQYLTALLQKMKPPQLPSYTPKSTTSSTSCYSSQTTRHHCVLLVVNCDVIKSSSMMTFLMYIYLGRAELSDSNVLDMYMLACSLRVPALKDLCKDFMWQAHIPDEQIKVPQLLVSNQRLETQDQATITDTSTEDKSTNTSHGVRGMEVATQTDRSTSEAGGGGQEEWVMLKKTKQKTVSPSKSRLIGKSLTGIDSPIGCKTGKKGWLSPKRRYKTENQIEGKAMEKEVAATDKEILHALPEGCADPSFEAFSHLDVTQNLSSHSNILETEAKGSLHKSFTQNVEVGNKTIYEKSQYSVNKQSLTPKKSARTTVEIATAAAAAKLAAHSYGTRTARGIVKIPVSYASLASGLEKKKSLASPKEKTILTMSKKKDFIKSNPETDFYCPAETNSLPKSDTFTHMLKNNVLESDSLKPGSVIPSEAVSENVSDSSIHIKADADTFKSSVKRPFKKSIVHRSRSEDVLNKNYAQLVSDLPNGADGSAGNESDFMDSYLIVSFVNTMKCDNAEVDIQKVINDLDTLSKSPLLTTASSSVSSTSLTSPLKSPSALLSTPDSSSPPKSRSTPQGFRKRLIHQINSEKHGPFSPKNIPSQDGLTATTSSQSSSSGTVTTSSQTSTVREAVSLTVSASLVSATTSLTTSGTSCSGETSQSTSSCDKLTTSYKTHSSSSNPELDKDQLQSQFPESVDELALSLYSLGEDLMIDGKASSFSSMTDIDLGLNDHTGQQFLHKIFKSKRRCKTRKSTAVDSDCTSVKIKTKKLQNSDTEEVLIKSRLKKTVGSDTEGVTKPRLKKAIGSDTEGSVAKPRLKKAIGSDTEGGVAKSRLKKATGSDTEVGASRSKQKKTVFSENEGALVKVRPPPKKRAKMELELLQAEDPEKHRDSRADKSEVEEGSDESKRDREDENSNIFYSKSKVTSSASDGIESESLKSDGQVKMKKASESMKTKSQRSSKTQEDATHMSDFEVTMETKLTLMLEELTEAMGLKTRQYSCKLCQTKFRSARRTIKHMRSHGLTQEDGLENITIGEKEFGQKACDICGYRTKDQSYHYMHIHKYFKHGVPLPLGWSTDKCEVCGKECFSKFQLKEHMMSHDDSHCFVCWHCGQSFKMRNGLNSHVFHKHCNIRKHQCKVCEKTFKTWTQLKVHVRSHTGDRPFACVECGHRSTTQGNMKLHLSTHGYSKEKIQELMEQICKSVPDMDPEALEKVMLSIAEKVKAEQTTVKEKKSKKKPVKNKTDPDDKMKQNNPPATKVTPPGGSSRKTKIRNNAKEQKTASVSKFAGSQIERLLTQPLNELKPPTFFLPQLSQPSVVDMGNHLIGTEESSHSQIFCDSTDSGLSTISLLLQQQTQKQETGNLPNGMFLIPLPHTSQRQLQQQQKQQQAAVSVSSMMGYTVIPAQILSGQSVSETFLDPSTGLALPVFSISDMLSSGLSLLQPGIQLVQADSVYSSNGQMTHDSETGSFLNSSEGHETLQVGSVSRIPYPNSEVLAIDSSKQDMNIDVFKNLISASHTTSGTTTMMMLPTVTSTAPQSQSLNQQATIFTYPSLISSGQSVLLPVTPDVQIISPDVQIIPSSLDASNFVNFSVTVSAPEEVVTLNMSQQSIGDVGEESEHILIETQEDDAETSVNVAIDDSHNTSGLVTYTVRKFDDESCVKMEGHIIDTEASDCVDNITNCLK